jgi:hypothetical protein
MRLARSVIFDVRFKAWWWRLNSFWLKYGAFILCCSFAHKRYRVMMAVSVLRRMPKLTPYSLVVMRVKTLCRLSV